MEIRLLQFLQDHVARTMRIKRGDRVKLTERGARINTRTYFPRAKRVDWHARRGTAHRVGRIWIYIRWDGRASIDYQQACLIEIANDEAPAA